MKKSKLLPSIVNENQISDAQARDGSLSKLNFISRYANQMSNDIG